MFFFTKCELLQVASNRYAHSTQQCLRSTNNTTATIKGHDMQYELCAPDISI